jgi:hypothetical protein
VNLEPFVEGMISGISNSKRGVTRKDLINEAEMTPQLRELEKRLLKCSFRIGDCDWCKRESKCQITWDYYCDGNRMNATLETMISSFAVVGIVL